jgi:hypothetical protein
VNGQDRHTEGARARPAEPSAAEASRLLAERLAREGSVVAHGTVPFRSGTEPRRGRRFLRFALAVLVGLLVVVALAVAIVAIATVLG